MTWREIGLGVAILAFYYLGQIAAKHIIAWGTEVIWHLKRIEELLQTRHSN